MRPLITKSFYWEVLTNLSSSRANGLCSTVLKQKVDSRGGSQNLSLKQELSGQITDCEVLHVTVIKFNHITQPGRACSLVYFALVMNTQAVSWAGLIEAYFPLSSNSWASHTGCLWLSGRGDSCPSSTPKQQWGGAQRSSIPSTGIQQIPEVSSPTIPEATAAGNRCDTPSPLLWIPV